MKPESAPSLDEFEVVGDANAWSRLARFVLNLDGERYDVRWWTGDYRQCVTSEMLIHPNSTFAIEGNLQIPEPHLDKESYFSSFENFQTAIRLANVTMRVPAVTDNIILSCDVLVRFHEMIMKVSHEIPRNLPKNVATYEQIAFPYDPSDLDVQQFHTEPHMSIPNDDKCNNKSAFGCHLSFVGASLTVAPIIPYRRTYKPEQVLLPTDIELLVRLETRAKCPATEDDWTGIESTIQIAVQQCEVNIDLDLFIAAFTVSLLHYNIIKELVKEYELQNYSQGSETIVFQQKETFFCYLRQCWKNGTVSTSCSLNVEMYRLCMWRQNVLRRPPMSMNVSGVIELLPILMVADFVSKDIVVNLCINKCLTERRTVGILRLKELSLSICDFERILDLDVVWVEIHKSPISEDSFSHAENSMVDVFSIGRSDNTCRALDVRIEEDNGDTSSYAFAADFADGIIDSNVESLSTFVLLIAEALVLALPELHNDARASNETSDECRNSQQSFNDEMSTAWTMINMNSFLEWFSTVVDKRPIDVLLVRLNMQNFQILISNGIRSDDRFTLELMDSEMILGFLSTKSHSIPKILDRFARGRRKWSSFVKEKSGLYHELKSRQCIQYSKLEHCSATRLPDKNIVVSAFDFLYTCYRGKIEVSTSDDFANGCMKKWKDCFVALQSLFHRSKGESRRVVGALHSAFNERSRARAQNETKYNFADPILSACVSTASALASLKNLSMDMKDKMNSLGRAAQTFKVESDDEIAKLRMHLLLKENERFRIQALVSSEAAGWLRVGNSQRSGRRGPFSSTLCNQWVVLRRSALLLFAYPGQVCIYLSNRFILKLACILWTLLQFFCSTE